MKRLLVGLYLLLHSGHDSLAWGNKGHEIIAAIAESRLTPIARRAVGSLLRTEGKSSLVDVAIWADGVRHLKIPLQPYHSVALPGNHDSYDAERDCRKGTCILAALDEDMSILGSPDARTESKVMALKYLVHFIGDIHMPLHATTLGRGYKVVFHHREVTLHKVWDTYIISAQLGNVRELAARIEKAEPPYLASEGIATVRWAMESRDITRDLIFIGPMLKEGSRVELSTSYSKENWPLVRMRLHQAGNRLAMILNRIYTDADSQTGAYDESTEED